MHTGQALDLVSRYDSLRNPLTSPGDYLDPDLIARCPEEAGTVTLRKRRLPLEMMVWCVVGMALEREKPLHHIVNHLDIMLPGGSSPSVHPDNPALTWCHNTSARVWSDTAGGGRRGLENVGHTR